MIELDSAGLAWDYNLDTYITMLTFLRNEIQQQSHFDFLELTNLIDKF
jgi:hypothetical protein